MPRSRGTEMALKQSPRTSPLQERKRVAELESKLSSALEEVKKLKEKLARNEVEELRVKLEEKERKVKSFETENERLRLEIKEVEVAHDKEKELGAKLGCMGDELNEIKGRVEEMKEKLESVEKEKLVMEMEMKKMKVQMEQWRKAAETAAAVIAEDHGVCSMEEEEGGRRKSLFGEFWKKKNCS
ncbi:interactor of constitutive active ROPs 4-like [Dioscorea cayenensis subsp. rotundata]|uniref:Interactor of constitutive active ROPs 4-like n=1 Tax=Dioscorea cayennensis subsp. rotundata TaxID=55577 RepID=A0AB40AL13_DIOCR|nr:interactor of constitutive active ROPs 4-like [Dioscorea cayenensis subsp. rotundata]